MSRAPHTMDRSRGEQEFSPLSLLSSLGGFWDPYREEKEQMGLAWDGHMGNRNTHTGTHGGGGRRQSPGCDLPWGPVTNLLPPLGPVMGHSQARVTAL